MSSLYIVAGLPGSGKTYFGSSLSAASGYKFIDDCNEIFKNTNYLHTFIIGLLFGKNYVISDPLAVTKEWQEGLVTKIAEISKVLPSFEPYKIIWIFFKNEPEICKVNASKRSNKEVTNYIDFLTANYNLPQGAVEISCYRQYS